MFVDTHAHLGDKAFDGIREETIKLSKEMGIEKIINSGFNLPSSLDAFNLCNNQEGLYCSVGFYPENIEELNEQTFLQLSQLASQNKVVAIGEIGLQYTENSPSKEKQKEGFLKQLQLAYSLQKPIIIHCREAYGDMLQLLKENKNLLKYGGTFHCFSGSLEIAKEVLKLGIHISVGGVSTFKNAEKLRETLKCVPLEKILLETDCPYLAPHPYRGKLNTPAYIPTIAQNLADIKGINVEEVASVTTKNAIELFKLGL